MQTFTTGELAHSCDIHLETLRYYERAGLMQPPPRSQSGHRQYPAAAAQRLAFIRRAQSLGFTLAEIKELLELKRHETDLCADVVQSIDAKLDEVEKKLSNLHAIRFALSRMRELCHGNCLIGDCPIVENLEHQVSSVPTNQRTRQTSGKSE